MSTRPMSNQEIDQFILSKWGQEGWSAAEIGSRIGWSRHKVRGRYFALSAKPSDPATDQGDDPGKGVQWAGDLTKDSRISCVFYVDLEHVIRSPEDLLKRANIEYDSKVWRIESFKCGAWTTPVKTRSAQVSSDPPVWQSHISVVQNYKVQVTFARLHPLNPEAMRDEIMEELKKFAPRYPRLPSTKAVRGADEHLLEICIFDLHFGKYAWAPETGQNYDCNIAEKLFFHALDDLLVRSRAYNVSRILLPLGNDLLHVNNLSGTTEHGTRQDVDTRIKHVMRRCRQMLVQGIDTLQQVAPVDVLVIPGNHDPLTCWAVGEALECWYDRCSRVTINNKPFPRKYYLWNNVLLGFTHGDRKHELQALPKLMPQEAKQEWAKARFTEFHIGHFHKRAATRHGTPDITCDTDTGVVVRTMDSLSGVDFWHCGEGYVGGPRAANALVWHERQGCVSELIAHAPANAYS